MKTAPKWLAFLVLAAAAVSGCGRPGAGTATGFTRSDELQEVAGMLRDYTATNDRGPAKVADLNQFESGYPVGIRAVRAGDIVVVWGAKMAGEGGGGREVIVAYEKKVPTEGGAVLLENGSIKQMTAEQFKTAPKAGS